MAAAAPRGVLGLLQRAAEQAREQARELRVEAALERAKSQKPVRCRAQAVANGMYHLPR